MPQLRNSGAAAVEAQCPRESVLPARGAAAVRSPHAAMKNGPAHCDRGEPLMQQQRPRSAAKGKANVGILQLSSG